jgi:hypothetical protein
MLTFIDAETRVPANHPLRTIKQVADEALARLSPEFDRMYAELGRCRRGCRPAGRAQRPSYRGKEVGVAEGFAALEWPEVNGAGHVLWPDPAGEDLSVD